MPDALLEVVWVCGDTAVNADAAAMSWERCDRIATEINTTGARGMSAF